METTTTEQASAETTTAARHLAALVAMGNLLDAADRALAECDGIKGEVQDELQAGLDRVREVFAETALLYVRELAAGNSSPTAA